MKNFKKVLIAGIAIGFGLSSSLSMARPMCDDMWDMCQEGNQMWCNMYYSDPECG